MFLKRVHPYERRFSKRLKFRSLPNSMELLWSYFWSYFVYYLYDFIASILFGFPACQSAMQKQSLQQSQSHFATLKNLTKVRIKLFLDLEIYIRSLSRPSSCFCQFISLFWVLVAFISADI